MVHPFRGVVVAEVDLPCQAEEGEVVDHPFLALGEEAEVPPSCQALGEGEEGRPSSFQALEEVEEEQSRHLLASGVEVVGVHLHQALGVEVAEVHRSHLA